MLDLNFGFTTKLSHYRTRSFVESGTGITLISLQSGVRGLDG